MIYEDEGKMFKIDLIIHFNMKLLFFPLFYFVLLFSFKIKKNVGTIDDNMKTIIKIIIFIFALLVIFQILFDHFFPLIFLHSIKCKLIHSRSLAGFSNTHNHLRK